MGKLSYVIPRIIRRYLPSRMVHWAKRMRLGIEPGLETREPGLAADRYQETLRSRGKELKEMKILILGYGGFFGLAVELLTRGAKHIFLVDPYAKVDHRANLGLLEKPCPYLTIQGKLVLPVDEWITLIHEDIEHHDFGQYGPMDLVFSSSVLEHISTLDQTIQALSKLTNPEGIHLHFVDVRDHFFKYPFEMLCYSEMVWRRYLNPPSNLNRLRVWDYETLFSHYFNHVEIDILEQDPDSLNKVRTRVKTKFLSGDESRDSATRLLITASHPRFP